MKQCFQAGKSFMACCLSLFTSTAFAALPIWVQADQNIGTIPPGGRYHECHGYVLHLSTENLRVHCLDGKPADVSFLTFPKYAIRKFHGRSVQDVTLRPGIPVHVIYSHELGIRHAYKVFVADPHGHGLFGFKS